jgi:hypothetical protein
MMSDSLKKNSAGLSAVVPYLESILAYAVIDAANVTWFSSDPFFAHTSYHPYWIPIFAVASRYGIFPSLFCGLCAAGQYLWGMTIGHDISRLYFERMAESGQLVLPGLFVIVAVMLGFMRQRLLDRYARAKDRAESAEASLKELRKHSDAQDAARRTLEQRLVVMSSTVKTFYRAVKRLESFDEKDTYAACLDVMREQLGVRKASVYLFSGTDALLKASVGWRDEDALEGRRVLALTPMTYLRKTNAYFLAHEYKRTDASIVNSMEASGFVLAVFPLRGADGALIGAVNIEKMDFMSCTRANMEVADLIVDWTSRMLLLQDRVRRTDASSLFDKTFEIFSSRAFDELIAFESARCAVCGGTFSVTSVRIANLYFLPDAMQYDLQASVIAELKRYIAESDRICESGLPGRWYIISPAGVIDDTSFAVDAARARCDALLQAAGHGNDAIRLELETRLFSQRDDARQQVAAWSRV